jgi:hypothetical protein
MPTFLPTTIAQPRTFLHQQPSRCSLHFPPPANTTKKQTQKPFCMMFRWFFEGRNLRDETTDRLPVAVKYLFLLPPSITNTWKGCQFPSLPKVCLVSDRVGWVAEAIVSMLPTLFCSKTLLSTLLLVHRTCPALGSIGQQTVGAPLPSVVFRLLRCSSTLLWVRTA